MRVGDKVLVDDTAGDVLNSSEDDTAFGYLHYAVGDKEFYIGVSPVGNPRVKVINRCGRGRELAFCEWQHEEK